jgi:hypothetical protein
VADGTIIGVAVGRGYTPFKGTPLINEGKAVTYLKSQSSVEDAGELPGANSLKWISTTTNSSWIENVRRRLIAQKVLTNLKWPSNNVERELQIILKNSKLLFDEDDKSIIQKLLVNKTIDPGPEFDAAIDPHEYQTQLTLTGAPGPDGSWPEVNISINGELHRNLEIAGQQTLTFTVKKPRRRNLIKIQLVNKKANDTLMENGTIVSNKHIKLDNFVIHGSRFDNNFLTQHGLVRTGQGSKEKGDGIYGQHDTYVLYFENPVHPYFISKHKFYYVNRFQQAKNILDKVTHLFETFMK